jgi:hypothetical protein
MSARICSSCQYNVTSTVVTACPNCGEALPTTLASASSSSMMLVATVLIAAAGAGAWYLMRGPTAVIPPTPAPAATVSRQAAPPATTIARPATPRAAASPAAPVPSARPAATTIDDRQVAGLITKLNTPATAWEAASALADIPSPHAEQALMSAYDKREYGKMAGAAGFYARRKPPAYEKVLVDLLNQSRDLAVAQDLILAKDPKISDPARKWAAEQGFRLVPSRKHPAA